MLTRLKGLNRQEQAACLIAERVLGAVAEPWDVAGRQGVVDAMLTLADGRRAAFEVTALAADGAIQMDTLLGRYDNEWPAPGEWWWTVQVGSVRDLPRLREVFTRIAIMCEESQVERPDQLRRLRRGQGLPVDDDLEWLVWEASSNMWGHPEVPARDGARSRGAMVTSAGRGGGVDHSLVGLHAALEDAFAVPHMARHLSKVAGAGCDERHLFVPIHRSALPFAVLDGLSLSGALPPEPPPLPEDVTHLWLAPPFSRRILLWRDGGWEQHHPYDE